MKNIKSLLAACAVLLVFGACGNGQPKEKEDNNNATVTSTPDLVFFDLQGPVKSCDIENGYYLFNGNHVEFDRSGIITMVDGYDPFVVKEPNYESDEIEYNWSRDEQGQIVSVASEWTGMDYTWENGRLAPIRQGVHEDLINKSEVGYDADGHVAKQTVYVALDDDPEDVEWELYRVYEFTYSGFDDHGNWTRCNVKYHDYEVDLDDEDEIIRTIVYY